MKPSAKRLESGNKIHFMKLQCFCVSSVQKCRGICLIGSRDPHIFFRANNAPEKSNSKLESNYVAIRGRLRNFFEDDEKGYPHIVHRIPLDDSFNIIR